MKNRPNILTIAGFDPTGGAGILADSKTFEENKCIGMAVQTANTIQSDNEFLSVNWIDQKTVEEQLVTLLNRFNFTYVKIGLIPNLELLNSLIDLCSKSNHHVKFVWDPVLSASAGFEFNQDLSNLEKILKKMHLITPNYHEIVKLSGLKDPLEGAAKLSQYTMVLLKGGHHPTQMGSDYLFVKGEQKSFRPKNTKYTPKHGTGCVLASAITANLAKGYPIQKSILRSKRYIERFIESNQTLIGTHKP